LNSFTAADMRRVLFTLLVAGWACFGLAQGTSAIKFPSPDGRFALRVADLEVDLIEMTTGKVMVDLGTLWINRDDESDREHPVLVWSGDSRWVAYGTRTFVSGSTTVYFWDGLAFKKLALPANLPEPKIKPRNGDSDVKLKGSAEELLKWIKPGELQLSSKEMHVITPPSRRLPVRKPKCRSSGSQQCEPNQPMKPTAPDRLNESNLTTDPCRGLSLSR